MNSFRISKKYLSLLPVTSCIESKAQQNAEMRTVANSLPKSLSSFQTCYI